MFFSFEDQQTHLRAVLSCLSFPTPLLFNFLLLPSEMPGGVGKEETTWSWRKPAILIPLLLQSRPALSSMEATCRHQKEYQEL